MKSESEVKRFWSFDFFETYIYIIDHVYEACQKFSTQYRPILGEILSKYMVLFLAVLCFFRRPLLSKLGCSECSFFTVIYLESYGLENLIRMGFKI